MTEEEHEEMWDLEQENKRLKAALAKMYDLIRKSVIDEQCSWCFEKVPHHHNLCQRHEILSDPDGRKAYEEWRAMKEKIKWLEGWRGLNKVEKLEAVVKAAKDLIDFDSTHGDDTILRNVNINFRFVGGSEMTFHAALSHWRKLTKALMALEEEK